MALDKQLVDFPLHSGVDTRNDEGAKVEQKNSAILNMRFTNPGLLNATNALTSSTLSPYGTPVAARELDDKIAIQTTRAVELAHIGDYSTESGEANSLPGVGKTVLLGAQKNTRVDQCGSVVIGSRIFAYWRLPNYTAGFTSGYSLGYQWLDTSGNKLSGGTVLLASAGTYLYATVTAGPTASTAYIWYVTSGGALAAKSVTYGSSTATTLTVPSLTLSAAQVSIRYSSTDTAWWIAYMTTDLFVSKYTISGSTVSAAISPVTVEATPSLFAIDIIRSTNYIAVGYIKVGTTAHLVKYYNTSLTLQTSKTLNSTWSVATGMSFGFGLVESSTADTLYAVAGVSPTLTLGETFQLYGHYSSWEVPYASSVVTHLDSTNYHNFKMTTRPFIHDGIVYAACVDVAAYSYKSYALVQFINKTGPYTTTSQAERISAVGFWGANIAGDGGVMASGTFSTARDTWNNVAVVNNKFFIINSYITDLTSLYEYPGTSTDCNPILPQYSTAARLFLYDTTQTPAMAGYNTGTAQVVCSNTVLGIDGLGVAPGALWPNQYAMAKKTSSASGFTNGDVINYVLERVWQDNYGNTHNIESQTIQYEAATNYQHCTIYTYSSQYLYTKYGDVGYKCATNIYRTDPNGTIPYYLTTVYSTTTSYTDTNSAALDYSRALPSASGELSTKLAASPRASCMWKSRIAILPADNPRSIWYTAPIQDGVFPQFKDGLEITIPQALNELTAIASMDGTLYAFTEDQVFTIYGEPYGATGENGTLSLPEMRFNGVGCRDSRSLILTPKGLVFHSAKGFYLILRNQELVYIGDGPFSSRANTVIGAHVNEEFGEATFLFSESGVDPVTGDTLTTAWVYDYNQNEWFKRGFNLAANTAADLFESDGDLSIVASSKIYYETTTKETITAYESPWIRLGSLQGYQRLYNILLKTQLVTACNLTIDLYVDYVDTSVYTWNLDSTTYTLTQGTIKLSAPTQKCEAFKLRIYMESQSTGGNLNLQGITAEIGVKPTTYKQSTGTNNT